MGGVEAAEKVNEAFEGAGAEGEEVELAFAADLDEAGGFKFLDVVGEGGGGDGKGSAGLSAAERTVGFGDAFKELETTGIRERLEDGGAASGREAGRPGDGRRVVDDGCGHFRLRILDVMVACLTLSGPKRSKDGR
jgi:hypothetical protein